MRHRRKDFNHNDRKQMARGDQLRGSLLPAVEKLRMNATQMRVGLARAGIMAQAGENPLQQLGYVLAVVGNIMTLRLSSVGDPKQKWGGNHEKRFGIARYNLVGHMRNFPPFIVTNTVLVGASAKGKTFRYRDGAVHMGTLAAEEGKPVCQAIGALNIQDADSVLDQLYAMYAGEHLLTTSTTTTTMDDNLAAMVTMTRAEQAASDAFVVQQLLGR